MLALFLIQSGCRFDTELLGPTIIQIIESNKDINHCNHSCNFFQPWIVWAESLTLKFSDLFSLLLCAKDHGTLVMVVPRKHRASVPTFNLVAFCMTSAT